MPMSHSLAAFSYNMHVLRLAVRLGEGFLLPRGLEKCAQLRENAFFWILIIIIWQKDTNPAAQTLEIDAARQTRSIFLRLFGP